VKYNIQYKQLEFIEQSNKCRCAV